MAFTTEIWCNPDAVGLNDGTSEANAYTNPFAETDVAQISADDTAIYFARGKTFEYDANTKNILIEINGARDNIAITTYDSGDGSTARPIIQGNRAYTTWTQVASSNVYYADTGQSTCHGNVQADYGSGLEVMDWYEWVKDYNLSNVTQAASNPTVTTSSAHGLTTGDTVLFDGILTGGSGSMTELNDQFDTITVTGSTTFTLDTINTSGYTAYDSGAPTGQVHDVEDLVDNMPPHSYALNQATPEHVFVRCRDNEDPDSLTEIRVANHGRFVAAIGAGDSVSAFRLDGLEITGFSRAAMNVAGVSGLASAGQGIFNNKTKWNGGFINGSNIPLGSGIQLTDATTNLDIYNNICYDDFDSPITLQINSVSATGTDITNCNIYNNYVYGGALSGCELAINASDQHAFNNVRVYNNVFDSQGRGFAGTGDTVSAQTPSGCGFITAAGYDDDDNGTNYCYDNTFRNINGNGVHIRRQIGTINVLRNYAVGCNVGIKVTQNRNLARAEDSSYIIRHNEVIDSTDDGINVDFSSYAITANTLDHYVEWNTVTGSTNDNFNITSATSDHTVYVRSNVSSGGTNGFVESGADVTVDYNSANGASTSDFPGGAATNDITSATLNLTDAGNDNRIASASGDCYNNAHGTPAGTDRRGYSYITDDRGALAEGKG